jgi:Calcineurin-like phosphoesterase
MLTRSSTTWISLAAGVVLGFVVLAVVANLAGPKASPSTTASSVAQPTGAVPASPSSTTATTTPPASEPPDPDAAVLIAAGDIASCTTDGDEATAKLLDNLPGTIATLGDNVYPEGTSRQFRECYDPTWGRQLYRTRPSPGNHEYLTEGGAGYFGYFGAAAGDSKSGYYAYDLGTWRIYSLNSACEDIGGCDKGSPQVAWLKADLAAHPTQCVLAYWHFPRFSSGRHGSQAIVAGLWDTLFEAGAEIVLNGHDHSYERFAPQSDAGKLDADKGIVEFVVGTGGFSRYEFPNILPTSRVRDNTSAGVIELTLSPGSWTSRFIPIAGQTFTDTASGNCH